MGLNDVSSAAAVSEQRCEAEALCGLPRARSSVYSCCALRCGETGAVTGVETVEDKLTVALVRGENVFKDRVKLN